MLTISLESGTPKSRPLAFLKSFKVDLLKDARLQHIQLKLQRNLLSRGGFQIRFQLEDYITRDAIVIVAVLKIKAFFSA